MAAIDINRGTTGINLPPDVSSEIWSKTQEASAIMNLATPMEMPGNGVEVDIITGDPTAGWVGETEERTVSNGTATSKKIKPYTLSVIVPFSRQFARDKARLYDEMVARIPGVLATKFDSTVFGNTEKPGELFDQLSDCTAVDVESDLWGGFVAADTAIAANNSVLNGYCISPNLRSMLLNAKDTMGRPLYVPSVSSDSVNMVLGNPLYQSRGCFKAGTAATASADGTPNQIGFAGDWTSARYGTVEGMLVSVADQATLKIGEEQVNLWQRGMFALMVEIEVGFRVKDTADFVKLVGKTPKKTS